MGERTIFEAISEGDVDGVEQMLRAAPSLTSSRTAEGISPLMLAWYTFNPRMRALLREYTADLDVFEAAMVGDVVRLTALLDADPASVRAYSADGFTLLHFAGFFNQPEVARVLLDRGAPLNVRTRNDLSNMPLHAAAAGQSNDVCRILLDAGADPNSKQPGGFTPLHEGAHHGNDDLVELLLSHDADAGLRNDDGKTAAEVAAGQGHAELAARLSP